jgi:hypothetical protein
MSKDQLTALGASFLRILVAAFSAAVLSVWSVTANHDIATWGTDNLRTFGLAVLGAVMVTLVNYCRTGETRFGVGADA